MEFPAQVPVLSDGVVTLRAPSPSDAAGVVAQCNDPVSIRWTGVPQPYGEEQALAWLSTSIPAAWTAETGFVFAIDYDGRFAGSVELRPEGGGNAEIAFGLSGWARGSGVAKRAVRLLLDWGFTSRGYSVVHWRAYAGNWGSRRVAWATGFHFGATIPGMLEQRGARHDAWTGWIGPKDKREPQTPWFVNPVLETPRVRLRDWREDELDRMSEARTNDATAHFLPFIRQPFDLAASRWLLGHVRLQAAQGLRFNWCVADPDTDVAFGNVTLFRLSDPVPPVEGNFPGEGELGYWGHPEGAGRGLMSAAVRRIAEWYFTPAAEGGFGGKRLFIGTAASNQAARRVAEAAGFEHVGTERAAFPLGDGTVDDKVVYDLLKG
ncbi:GNAT family N-acetyltransferase [Kribbella deserti]|uniref:GNAT family N-acetyltransferase n=1 Tax=Kribbella deserti TaxID=1926257 RepID=A0ABV6QXA3_9ACTN